MIIKPAGASCNLKCDYCYYRGKDSAASGTVMDEQFLERFVRTYIMSQPGPEVLFVWHGGEPLLRPLSFYRKAVELQEKYAGGMLIDNCLQTNGTLLDEDWCRFLRDNRWLVGISLDGPERFHDSYRRDTHGNPSFSKVMKSIEMMTRFGVEWNAMAVVNDYNSCHPLEFYRFFKSLGCRFLQFTPVTDRMSGGNIVSPSVRGAGPADFSVTSEGWGNFLCAVFDEWVKNDVGDVFVQIFDSALACWAGVPPSLCSMSSLSLIHI